MLKYSLKRLLQSLITILIAVTLVFLMMRMLPTDYYFTEDQLMKFTPEQKQAALEAAGLLDPIGEQLIRFYGQLLHLDFGTLAENSKRHRCHPGHWQPVGCHAAPGRHLHRHLLGGGCSGGHRTGRLQGQVCGLAGHGLHRRRQRGARPGHLLAGAGHRFHGVRHAHPVFHPQPRPPPACCPSYACPWRRWPATRCGCAGIWWTS